MPLLPSEPDMFPAELLDPLSLSAESPSGEGTWWALYTLARREKELARRLIAQSIPFYAPQIHKRSRSPGGRVRSSFVPLFPSYVFLRGGEDERQRALATGCVSRTIVIADSRQLVHDLRQIRQLIATDAPLTIEARIEAGQRVRVRSGPMLGLEGIVVKRRGRDWLLVAVEFLQQGASVLLEDFRLEPV